MSRLPDNLNVTPSLLDRLLFPTAQSRAMRLRDLKAAVRRDLENLLNTRWRCKTYPPRYRDLGRSLVNYGIPDISQVNLSDERALECLLNDIRESIIRFEPRFSEVEVTPVANPEAHDRTLRFRIFAVLDVEPYREGMSFDSTIEPVTSLFSIQ